MGRPKLADPPTEISVSIPTTLLAKVDLYLFDPLRSRVAYGARSRLITQLLNGWVSDREALATANTEETTNEQA